MRVAIVTIREHAGVEYLRVNPTSLSYLEHGVELAYGDDYIFVPYENVVRIDVRAENVRRAA